MNFLLDYTTALVLVGNLAFSCTAGMLAPFVTLRRESFLGDGTAHAALAGIFFILIFPSLTTTPVLLAGGLIAALLAHFILFFLNQETKLNKDVILATTLSLFIALALVLFTALIGHLEKLAVLTNAPATERSSTLIRHYIFGSPASLTEAEALLLITVALSATIMVLCFYKIWKLFAFDAKWARTLGFSFSKSEFLFKALFITTIMTGIFSVGALMVSALFVAPSIAARVFTNRLKPLIALSITINFITTSLALFLGSKFTGIPEGPMIVFLTSLLAVTLPLISYSYHHLWGICFKDHP